MSVLCVYFCVYSLQTNIIVSLIHYFSVLWVRFVSTLFNSLFCFFFFLWSIYMYLHCKKRRRRWILILKRWNPNTFLFSYLPVLFLAFFLFLFFLWSIYLYLHCIYIIKKKINLYFKKMKSKHILIFLSDCILLLICLIYFAFLT